MKRGVFLVCPQCGAEVGYDDSPVEPDGGVPMSDTRQARIDAGARALWEAEFNSAPWPVVDASVQRKYGRLTEAVLDAADAVAAPAVGVTLSEREVGVLLSMAGFSGGMIHDQLAWLRDALLTAQDERRP